MWYVRAFLALICVSIGAGAAFAAISDIVRPSWGSSPGLSGGIAAFFLMAAWLSFPRRA